MKRLNLGKLKLTSGEVLQRNQLATIYGGSGSGTTCWLRCSNDWQKSMEVANCGTSTLSFYCLAGSEPTCNCN